MSKTIEERLEELLKQSLNAYPWGRRYPSAEFYPNDELAEPKRAITKPWTTAVKAMEAVLTQYDERGDTWYCYGCAGADSKHSERHTPDNCYVAACQAALAAMKGETDEGS